MIRKPSLRVTVALVVLVLLQGRVLGQLREVYIDTDSSNVINRVSFFSSNEGYVAFSKWIGHTTDSGRTFAQLYITNINVNYNGYSVNLTYGFQILGVQAFNSSTVIAYGDYGLVPAILYSTNGGANWTLIFESQYSPTDLNGGITDMLFPQNDNIGYAIDADRILKTTNGGQNWTVVETAPNSFFNHLEAVNDNTVIAMSTGSQTPVLLQTANGGSTWLPIAFPPVTGAVMTYTYFLTATTGWMSLYDPNYNYYFYQTTNGGTTWSLLNNLTATPFSCAKMHFTDANTGYALVAPFQVYKTVNGGVLWEPLPRDNAFTYLGYTLNDLQFNSATQFWAGGGHGYLEMTTNGGGTPIPTAYFLIDTSGENATGTVNLNNYSNSAYTFKWLVNGSQIGTSYNASYTHVLSRFADTITLIVTSGGISDTVSKYQYFQVPSLPVISSFSPQGGGTGAQITINGSGLTNVTAVSFGGVPATSFTVVSDNQITAVVAGGASGAVTVTDIHGSYSLNGFIYVLPPSGPPPAIVSVTPAAAPIGSTVTIGGSGFGATTAANMVYFGTIRTAIQSASSTSIVCTVPAGASFGPILVINSTTGLVGQSSRQFNIPFADSSNFTPTSFNPVFTVTLQPTYNYPISAYGRDLDGDGKPDMLLYYEGFRDTLSIYRNIGHPGTISFAPPVVLTTLYDNLSPGSPTIQDIDGDGKPDLIMNGNLTVYRNTSTPGNFSFSPGVAFPTNANSAGAVIATDLDNDGRIDIATVNFSGGIMTVLRNTGAPGLISFAPMQWITVGGNPAAISAGDIDGDGKSDLLVCGNDGTLSILRNTSTPGNIAFAGIISLTGPGVGDIWLTDFDGDGKLDLVVATGLGLNVFRNLSTPGNIAFAPVITYPCPSPAFSQGQSLSNYGGGSIPDMLSGNWETEPYLLFRNISKPGVFGNNPVFQYPGYYSYFTDAADFDGDGKPDFVSSMDNSNYFSVYQNTVGTPQPFQVCRTGTATISSDMTGVVYQWQRNAGSGYVNIVDSDTLSGTATPTLTFNNPPPAWNGFRYRCKVDSLYSSVFGLSVAGPESYPINITASDSVTCYGTAVIFNATTTDALNDYGIIWLVNGIKADAFGASYTTDTLQNTDQVQALLSITNACGSYLDTSRAIPMKVTELPDSITISTPTGAPCFGDSVTVTASTVNAGANPVYTWSLNRNIEPQTGPVFTFTYSSYGAYLDVNRIQATLQSSAACADPIGAVSNIVETNFFTKETLSVQVVPYATTICQGTLDVFGASATVFPGGTTNYIWFINGVNVGDATDYLSSYSMNNNDTVQCIITSNRACLTSDSAVSAPVVMTVYPMVNPSVSVLPVDTLVCAGSSPVFTALPTNGGDAPTYQWWVNGAAVGGNQPKYTETHPTNGNTITVTVTSNASCLITDTATSSPVLISVNIPSVRISGDSVLSLGASASFSAAADSGGVNPLYQWQDSSASHGWQNLGASGALITYTPISSGVGLRCILTDVTGCSATSNTVIFRLTGTASGAACYPNPAYTVLNVVNAEPSDPLVALTVTDAFGNQCLTMTDFSSQNPIRVDVAPLSNGFYFVRTISTSGKISHFSFIKL